MNDWDRFRLARDRVHQSAVRYPRAYVSGLRVKEARKEEERKKQKEIEAVRRRADARWRSSRVSGAGPRKSVGRPSLANAKSESLSPVNGQILTIFSENKGSASRFGFLS